MREFTITTVSEILSISADTLRSWQRRGLMRSLSHQDKRSSGEWRRFLREDILRIGLAKRGAEGGVPPADIRELLNWNPGIINGNIPYFVGTSFHPTVYKGDPAPEQESFCNWYPAFDESVSTTDSVSAILSRQALSPIGGPVRTFHVIDVRSILAELNGRIDWCLSGEVE